VDLRLVRASEPFEVRENTVLRQRLMRLTYGTHDRGRGFVFLPSEAQALYAVLAHKTFSAQQLDQIEEVVREMDPHELDSKWDDQRLMAFVGVMCSRLDRPEWVDGPIRSLHAAMRLQSSHARFRLWFTRAALVTFLTTDFLPPDLQGLPRLAG
jgi:hypothetical protein